MYTEFCTYWVLVKMCVKNISVGNSVIGYCNIPQDGKDATTNKADKEVHMKTYAMLVNQSSEKGRNEIRKIISKALYKVTPYLRL